MAELTEQEKAAISREYRRKTNREYLRVWRDANREKYNKYQREYRRKYRARQKEALEYEDVKPDWKK